MPTARGRFMSSATGLLFFIEFSLFCVSTHFTMFFPASLMAQKVELKGLLSSWAALSAKGSVPSLVGFRWVPGVIVNEALSPARFIEVEVALNGFGTAEFKNLGNILSGARLKLYRVQARYSATRFEVRVGLQKLSFGSAAFHRPLMWFDRLDPRDPLQLTEGVYGLLLRYYFLSNANIWFWGLYGNEKPKGWELLPTARKRPEWGGRLQVPLSAGELGFTFHHRRVSLGSPSEVLDHLTGLKEKDSESNPARHPAPEYRWGLDGKWDLGVGLWFEAVLARQETRFLAAERQKTFTLGLDYTFPLGQGLHVLTEYYESRLSGGTSSRGDRSQFAAFSLSYPLGLFDSLNGVVFYDCKKRDTYLFFRWQRTYDRWNFHLMAFWNPERLGIYHLQDSSASNLFAGKGLQLMVVFHY
ncbi:MAG: hypothetical protein ACUVR0_10900 [Candidatus Aminicenantales bacterium]